MIARERIAGRRRRAPVLVALVVATGALGAAIALAQDNAEGVDFSAIAGEELETRVATFTHFDASAGDFAAGIAWGDGGPNSIGTIAESEPCPYPDARCFEVRGTHTYADPGTYPVEVTVSHGPDDPNPTRVRATATVRPPEPGGPTARIALVESEVRPGEPAIVDASDSEGEIESYAFDLNGNGTYETKSRFPHASVLRTVPGSRPIGVRVTGTDGTTSTAVTILVVTGAPLPPPSGKPQFEQGTTVGSPHPSQVDAVAEALLKAYTCPVTVEVGVAEASIPPEAPADDCFERRTFKGILLSHKGFQATGMLVVVNGLEVNTDLGNVSQGNVRISEDLKTIVVVVKKKLPLAAHGAAKIRVAAPGYGEIIGGGGKWSFGTWNVAKAGIVSAMPVGFGGRFLGLPYALKDTPIKLPMSGHSEVQVFPILPFTAFTVSNNAPTGKPFTVRADSTAGLKVDGAYSYPFNLPLGIFNLSGEISYSQQGASHVWSGDVSLRIPGTPVKDIDGTITFRDGEFEQATVGLDFERPGLGPIGCCVYLVGLGGALTPDAIQGSATFAAGPTLYNDFRAAEVTATVEWGFSPFSLALTADNLRIAGLGPPLVNATGTVLVNSSQLLASASWDTQFGPFGFNVISDLFIGSPWYILAGGEGCIHVWFFNGLCTGVNAGAGPTGIAVCGYVLKWGGGVRIPWNPTNWGDWGVFTGCGWGHFLKKKVGAARLARAGGDAAAAAAGGYRVPRGLRAALFAIEGSGGQPQVRVVRPHGGPITTPPPGEPLAKGGGWTATRDTNDDTTYLLVRKPAAGRWRFRALAGSPAITSIGLAKPLPARFARGQISGRGHTRILRYRVNRPRGTRITFIERGGDPASGDPERVVTQTIGRARATSGRIRFTPVEGKVRARKIEAVVTSKGTAIKSERIAGFTAPRFHRPAAPRVRVSRVDGGFEARWSRVRGALAYQVFVNRSDAATEYLRRPAGRRVLRAGGIGPLTEVAVAVRTVSPAGYIGKQGIGRLSGSPAIRIDRRQRIAAVLRAGGLAARCTAAGDGRCEVVVARGARILATGGRTLGYGQTKGVKAKLTRAGRRALSRAGRQGRRLRLTIRATVPGREAPTLRVRLR